MEDRRWANSLGGFALVVNIIALNCTLLWLRARPGHTAPEVLALGNLFFGLIALVPLGSSRHLKRPSWRYIIIWSVGYCLTYYVFVTFPSLLPLSLLRVAQTVAPTAAVFITGDWRREQVSRAEFALAGLGLLLLAGMAYLQTKTSFQLIGLLIFIGIALYDLVSQSIARVLVRSVPGFWISAHLSLTNGIMLTAWAITRHRSLFTGQILRDGGLLAVGIFVVQIPLFFGLRLARPLMAGLILATGVLAGTLLEAIVTRNRPANSVLLTGVIFTCVLAVSKAIRTRRISRTELANCGPSQRTSADVL